MLQNTANPTLEQSIGGSISVTGSAYAFGCGSQMTQYQLAEFGPVTFGPGPGVVHIPAPVPSPTALGGTPLIAPVVYDGTAAHPWSSGCFLGFPVPNTILNGDLVAWWTTENCWAPLPLPGHSYTIQCKPNFSPRHPRPSFTRGGDGSRLNGDAPSHEAVPTVHRARLPLRLLSSPNCRCMIRSNIRWPTAAAQTSHPWAEKWPSPIRP